MASPPAPDEGSAVAARAAEDDDCGSAPSDDGGGGDIRDPRHPHHHDGSKPRVTTEEYWARKRARQRDGRRQRARDRKAALNAGFAALSPEEQAAVRAAALEGHRAAREAAAAAEALTASRLASLATPAIVYDLRFFDAMDTKGKRSTVLQLQFSFSMLRRAQFPLRPVLAGTCGSIETLRSWEGYAKTPPLFAASVTAVPEAIAAAVASLAARASSADAAPESTGNASEAAAAVPAVSPLSSIVYLTADSPTVLERLVPGEIYVVGAFVDHNSKKGATLAVANELGLRTARLPIKEHIVDIGNLCQVLTIDHMTQTLVRFSESQSWPTAFECLATRRRKRGHTAGSKSESDEEAEQNE